MKRGSGGSGPPAALRAPRGLEVEEFTLGTDDLVLLSFDAAGPPYENPERLQLLTPAEREVMEQAFEGGSNLEIARTRGRSLRTVQAQLATIYRKLGVSGRRELRAVLGRSSPGLDLPPGFTDR